MKTRRELEQKEKKIREALAEEEREERIIEFKKRYLVILGFLVLFGAYLFLLQTSYSSFKKYDDSTAREKYASVIENFNNLSRYHLTYKTSFARGSIPTEVYYIKDKLFFIRYESNGRIETLIYLPHRNGTTLSKQRDYNGDCVILQNSTFKENPPCLFDLGLSSNANFVPINIGFELTQALPSSGKIFLSEKKISGESILCFDTKIDTPIFSQNSLYGLGKYFPTLIRFIQKAPHEIGISGHSCFTKHGVLVQTPRYEKFVSIDYSFNDSFLSDLPLYPDFQKFINKSFSNRSEYYKFSIDTISTYFKDFGNYIVFGSFGGKEYFTSGCVNGTDLAYNRSCTFEISYPQLWMNNSFYPLKYIESRIIANYSTDCFEYTLIENGLESRNEFCIVNGGYMVSKYTTIEGETEGYENTNISTISKKEFEAQMAKAVYLASLD